MRNSTSKSLTKLILSISKFKKIRMKKILAILLMSISFIGYAQQNNGAIKTKNGLLLYFNLKQNSHTLNLKGEIDVSKFPFIKQDSIWFQFLTNNKVDFEKNSKSILENYMIWEFDYLQKQFGEKLVLKNEPIELNDLTANYWYFKNPKISDAKIHSAIKSTYFLDFTKKDLIYRFSYASISGDDLEAKAILKSIAENLKFYENGIDIKKLQMSIINDVNY